MGVLPLEFTEGDSGAGLSLTGAEDLAFEGLDDLSVGTNRVTLRIRGRQGPDSKAVLRLRIFSRQELAYLRHGGILPYVVRRTLAP
ncbi:MULTISPECIES: hypothetical protein [Streptomyces]|uniref:Uncharacterized protein n=1 Tax=Streptomyces koelreuteriae TaxID=2838015 RepID=A0ABX8G3Z8_9ACTN|nr:MULTISPECIES: hypothetical protein [Streptomyces]QWB28081.1 hypothetical protein KJK29_02400 [Streptomyces koelreuteriae]UUA11573.1 hypothetical protein NNW98_02410 [Streptomyces koelreuteriae]UUA19171.1 hypothetical protein NNW99_02410 [Streptomyces sp. CRCS-T-1]